MHKLLLHARGHNASTSESASGGKLGRFTKTFAGRLSMIALAGIIGLTASSPAIAATAQKKKPLSLKDITIESGPNAVNGATFIAFHENFFAKYGLNAHFLNINTGSSQDIAALVGGAAQFAVSGAATEVAAAQAGGPIRGILVPSIGGPQQIDLTQAFATAHNIPTNVKTPKQALAQFLALKGTHAVIANSSVTSNSYQWMAAAMRKYGMTWGVGCTTCDIDTTYTGTVPNLITAFAANKVDGIANVPPTTSQPNGVVVPYGMIPPLDHTEANYMVTSPEMIQQHPDTVQAVVNTMVYTMAVWRDFGKKHEARAEADIEAVVLANGGTQDQAVQATKIQIPYLANPFPTKLVWNTTINTFNISISPPYTLKYADFNVPRFAASAERLLGIPVPKNL